MQAVKIVSRSSTEGFADTGTWGRFSHDYILLLSVTAKFVFECLNLEVDSKHLRGFSARQELKGQVWVFFVFVLNVWFAFNQQKRRNRKSNHFTESGRVMGVHLNPSPSQFARRS